MAIYEIKTTANQVLWQGDDFNLAVQSYYDFKDESKNDIDSPIFSLEIIAQKDGERFTSFKRGGTLKSNPKFIKGEIVLVDDKKYLIEGVLRDMENTFHYRLQDGGQGLIAPEVALRSARTEADEKLETSADRLAKLIAINDIAYIDAQADSGGELYSNDKKAEIYLKEIKGFLKRNNYPKPLSMSIFKKLEDQNLHSLNNALSILGYYGGDLMKVYKDAHKEMPNMYLTPSLVKAEYSDVTFAEKIIRLEVLKTSLEKDSDSSPKDILRLNLKIELLKEQVGGGKFAKGGQLGYDLQINKIIIHDLDKAIELEEDARLRGIGVVRNGKMIVVKDHDKVPEMLSILNHNCKHPHHQFKLKEFKKGGVVEAKEYFIDYGFIEELKTDERYFVEMLLNKNVTKKEVAQSKEYFYQTDNLYGDKKTIVDGLIKGRMRELYSYEKGGDIDGKYSSVHDFISRNKLEKEAENIFGKNWEPDNDMEQIRDLAGINYEVEEIDYNTSRDMRSDDYIRVYRYKKGGALSKEFKFDKNFVVYVPSTSDVSDKISPKELDKRVDEVKEYVANTFGGYTETETEGGYKSSKGEIVEEDVVKVSVFSKTKDWKDKEFEVVQKVKEWSKEWGQEAIGFEYEGDLYYIDASGKFGKGGTLEKMSWGGTIDMPRGSGWGDFKKGKRVLSIKDIKEGKNYLSYSSQFDAKNVVFIIPEGGSEINKSGSSLFDDRKVFIYVKPENVKKSRVSNDIPMKLSEQQLQDNYANYNLFEIKGKKYD